MSDDEARDRYEKYKYKDPYPDIAPALLNSADIISYCNATGMLSPFEKDRVKSASYRACISGACWYWEEDGKKKELVLNKGDKFTLEPNSIAYVEIGPKIRLPHYIAIRFNLKITHVYRGLLLGTGPLVDPGFEGKIFIPLHNMTGNSYTFSEGEDLIWIEFTKISTLPKSELTKEVIDEEFNEVRVTEIIEFPETKKNKHIDYYIKKALEKNKSDKVLSSIPLAIQDSKNAAIRAQKYTRRLSIVTGISVMLGVVGIGTLFYESWGLQSNYISGVRVELIDKIKSQKNEINDLEEKIDEYEKLTISQGETLRNQGMEILRIKRDLKEIPRKIKGVEPALPKVNN